MQPDLGESDHVGHKIGLVAEAEKLASAAKPRHDLVADHQDAVLIAELADT
jgi:hypothetical protein